MNLVDLKAGTGQVVERLPGQVGCQKADGERLEEALNATDGGRGAADVLQHQQLPARPEHSESLFGGGVRVRDRAETEGAGHRLETLVRQVEILDVADPEVNLAAELLGPLAPDRRHLGTQLDCGQLYPLAVMLQVPESPGSEFQDVPLSP